MDNWDIIRSSGRRFQQQQQFIKDADKKIKQAKTSTDHFLMLETDERRLKGRALRTNQEVFNPFEKNIGTIDYQDANILELLSERARAVCCIERNGRAIGTGFLVAKNVIITNHHVIRSREEAENVVAKFNYELDLDKQSKRFSSFNLNPDLFFMTSPLTKSPTDPYSGLDFTLIGAESVSDNNEQLSNYRPAYLDGNEGKYIIGDNCIIIHHPEGKPKQVSIKDSTLFYTTEDFLFYESDTVFGSSGSMVVALGTGEIVALHHAGQPNMDENSNILTRNGDIANENTPDSEIDWIANKGVRIDRIVNVIRNATLDNRFETVRRDLLSKTDRVRVQLNREMQESIATQQDKNIPIMEPQESNANTRNIEITAAIKSFAASASNPRPIVNPVQNTTSLGMTDYLVMARYDDATISSIQQHLRGRYGKDVKFLLAMPDTAQPDALELFTLSLRSSGNQEETARQLLLIPGIEYAESDIPLGINTGDTKTNEQKAKATESMLEDDGYSEWNERCFLEKYENKSPYIRKGQPLKETRRWNWHATGFNKLNSGDYVGVNDIRIVQFDTGWTTHSKVKECFDLEVDYDFIDLDPDAQDPFATGVAKFPGHGTRTGSLLVGNELADVVQNGNSGLLSTSGYKLIPYRISQSVILINRQKQLAKALDAAISNQYDIITMSMGTVPTVTTAKLARKAYDAGVIWCCAAGNVVQAVIAPAVFPGTIAVAASNPLDEDWKGSSRGDRVDITAPGEDVYVPIFTRPVNGSIPGESMAYGDGTSFATPHVAAAAALWLAKHKKDLEKGNYLGWQRIEAFKKALKDSSREAPGLPGGFGKGILDVPKLLTMRLAPKNGLQYAYTGKNDNLLYQTLQAWSEAAKTYWNIVHGAQGGDEFKDTESLSMPQTLTPYSAQLMNQLFPGAATPFESLAEVSPADSKYRLEAIMHTIENQIK